MVLAGFAVSNKWKMDELTVREHRKKAMIAEVDTLSEDDFADLERYISPTEKESLKEIAKKVIEETFQALDDRDVTTWFYKNVVFYFTGGLSWGDNPTDSFDTFAKFSCLPDKVVTYPHP